MFPSTPSHRQVGMKAIKKIFQINYILKYLCRYSERNILLHFYVHLYRCIYIFTHIYIFFLSLQIFLLIHYFRDQCVYASIWWNNMPIPVSTLNSIIGNVHFAIHYIHTYSIYIYILSFLFVQNITFFAPEIFKNWL